MKRGCAAPPTVNYIKGETNDGNSFFLKKKAEAGYGINVKICILCNLSIFLSHYVHEPCKNQNILNSCDFYFLFILLLFQIKKQAQKT